MKTNEVCNIWKCECYVTLKSDQNLCPKCKGQGAVFINVSFKQRHFSVQRCPLCLGEGKVDWITTINKQFPISNDGYPLKFKVKQIKMRCIGPKHCKKKLKRLWMQYKRFEKLFVSGGQINVEELGF